MDSNRLLKNPFGTGATQHSQEIRDGTRTARRMVKKFVQRGRSKRGGEGILCSARRASKRRENKAGGLFQHPAKDPITQLCSIRFVV